MTYKNKDTGLKEERQDIETFYNKLRNESSFCENWNITSFEQYLNQFYEVVE